METSPRVSRTISLQGKSESPPAYQGSEAVTIEIVQSTVKATTLHKHVLYAISVTPRDRDKTNPPLFPFTADIVIFELCVTAMLRSGLGSSCLQSLAKSHS